DAIANNDLLYVPANSSDIHFGSVDADGNGIEDADAAEQYAALDKFIEQDPYLSERRGDYAERNGASLPWFSQIDVRYMHDFNFKVGSRTNTIQLSFDVMNIGNMVNSNWGVRQFATTYNPITVTGVDNNNVPYMHFDTNLQDSFVDDFSTRSKWQLQIGVRYIF
ncbi:MAG: TonB-dependent receptor, partial [Bacteroidales bacterium]|nr:TonB-dependent receptor [Bacteroidales bacterium]